MLNLVGQLRCFAVGFLHLPLKILLGQFFQKICSACGS